MKCNAHEGVYEQGKEAGEMIGIKIGKKIKSHEIAIKLLLKGTSFEDIVELTDLSLSEILKLSNQIKH